MAVTQRAGCQQSVCTRLINSPDELEQWRRAARRRGGHISARVCSVRFNSSYRWDEFQSRLKACFRLGVDRRD